MRHLRLIYTCCLFFSFSTLQAQYYGVDEPKTEDWSIGLNLGVGRIFGDVEMDLVGYYGGLYAQKSVANAVDVRLSLGIGNNSGLNITPSTGFLFNPALNGERDSLHAYDSTMKVYHNFRMVYWDASFLFKFNIDRLIKPSGSQNFEIYALAGVGAFFYETNVNAFDEATGMIYPYDSLNLADPIGIKNQLKNLLDDSYETLAQRDELNSSRLGNFVFNTEFVLGFGGKVFLGEHVGLGIEGKMYFIGNDLLDGQQFLDNNEASLTNDRPVNISITLDYTF